MCDHLKYLRNKQEYSDYKSLLEFFVTCTKAGSSKKNTLLTSCHVCRKSGVGARLHACLSCVFIGCLKTHFEQHRENHKFAMDLLSGSIYCFECGDYAYDEYFSKAAKRLKPSGQIKESFYWLPPKEDWKFFQTYKPAKMNQSVVGLRGLSNLGLTCYVNCIIQVFANTPMMRNYFLSGRHLCQLEKDDCQACLLSGIFQELYSGKKDPLSLSKIVYDLWTTNSVFCGRDSYDAQEFYEFYLGNLHNYCIEEVSEPCRCVIHQIFSGKYQNVEICSICGVLSSVNLEAWSISLDKGNSKDEAKLTDCIQKRIQGIQLTNAKNENITCKKCEKREKGEKGIKREQLVFKVLPNILCFHFPMKSSEESSEKSLEKIEKPARITFPEYLDMSLYTPETAKSSIWNENGVRSLKKYQKPSKKMYILYAIVGHRGTQKNGHYYSYVRKGKDTWYKCNDADIRKVEFEEVSKDSGVLFFYIKEVLEYEKTRPHLNEHEGNNCVQRINNVNGYS